jgi:uncharacterized membrane protein YGL010W
LRQFKDWWPGTASVRESRSLNRPPHERSVSLLSIPLALGAAPLLIAFLWSIDWLERSSAVPMWSICVLAFVVAWIGQFIGHAIEGKRPSFFKDVQFLMIGPLWLLADVYRRLGIRF